MRRAHHFIHQTNLEYPSCPAPVRSELASFDIAMKTAMRPIDYTGDVPVLDGVEMNVIDMPIEISFIANGVLPVAALPDAFLPLGNLAFRSRPGFKTA